LSQHRILFMGAGEAAIGALGVGFLGKHLACWRVSTSEQAGVEANSVNALLRFSDIRRPRSMLALHSPAC
jgi:hypothetical protein